MKKLAEQIEKFCNDRNWKQFHDPKDLALSLVLESTEVLEHFQWKSGDELKTYLKKNKKEISHELADTLYWLLKISHDLDIDLEKAFQEKMKINAKKYPIKKAKGRKEKYNQL